MLVCAATGVSPARQSDSRYISRVIDGAHVVILDATVKTALLEVAGSFGTPSYVYFPDRMVERLGMLRAAFGDRLRPSFAMKCNPNVGLLSALRGSLDHLDASSIGEVERGLAAGYSAASMTFSGPGKRPAEIRRAVDVGVGAIVCESESQLAAVSEEAVRQQVRQTVLLRINPHRVPKTFGLQMGGRSSQFGVDEEACEELLDRIRSWPGLDLAGFHIFSGGNSLNADALVENFEIMASVFEGVAARHQLSPRVLVFGSGFGIPYFDEDLELDIAALANRITPLVARLLESSRFQATQCFLEFGRWLVGPQGYLLTRVVERKHSRGKDFLICDAGFNNHLSASGMMGTIVRRNWPIWNVSAAAEDQRHYQVVGPLCASFDQLATNLMLPATNTGDLLAVGASGAYGLTASPTRFISHPEPGEYLVREHGRRRVDDVTESKRVQTPAVEVKL